MLLKLLPQQVDLIEVILMNLWQNHRSDVPARSLSPGLGRGRRRICKSSSRRTDLVKRCLLRCPSANDIVGLGDRLSTIEGGTTDLSRRLDQLIEVVLDRKSPSKTYGVDTNDSVPNKRETTASQATKPAIHSLPDLLATDAPNAMLERSADEQYHTFSTISLFRHARQLVLKHFAKKQNVPVDPFAPTSSPASGLSKTDMTGARNPTFVIDISRQDSLYPLPSPYLEKSVKIDQQPIKLPPRSILDDAQMFYFDNVLLEMPLFRRETFLGAIEVQYRLDPSQIDKAWAVCFDCVILQSLGTKSKLVLNGSNLRTLSNSDLQTSILETLKAIILNLNEFSQPCILNVQALLLLVSSTCDGNPLL